jgi:3-oxoacyl-[acyl-carrier-protein] synthase II
VKQYPLTDHLGRPRIVVTGMGMVTALGMDLPSSWAALKAGRPGVREITRFATQGMRTRIGACVDLPEDKPGLPLDAGSRAIALGRMALGEAVAQSGLPLPFPGPLALGTMPIEFHWPTRLAVAAQATDPGPSAQAVAAARDPALAEAHSQAAPGWALARHFGTRGMPQMVTTACASGVSAIMLAAEALRRGEAEAVLTGGVEGSMTPETMIRFALLQALSSRNDTPESASRPFSRTRDGFVMGDGAAGLVLETAEHALARGATILGTILGVGECADTFHRTRSNPDGGAIVTAMRRALDDAGITPAEIGAINAHGTSTPENDKMEAMAVRLLFGEAPPPITSTKSMTGHTLSAAGAIEAVISLLTVREGVIPPTINQDGDTDTELGMDVVADVARPVGPIIAALSNSFGFGGQNACVVVGA